MAYCSNCGKEIADGVRYCPECGAVVTRPVNTELPEKNKILTVTGNGTGRIVSLQLEIIRELIYIHNKIRR